MKTLSIQCAAAILIAVMMQGLRPDCLAQTFPELRVVQLCGPQFGFEEDGFEAGIARQEKAVRQLNALAPDMTTGASIGNLSHYNQ
ncbi:MAG: hypothetical protein LBJ01_02245 [Tannerella sp.]|jgi:hypothetical protein|nr:hypothetical protein [Tannerella sp.]